MLFLWGYKYIQPLSRLCAHGLDIRYSSLIRVHALSHTLAWTLHSPTSVMLCRELGQHIKSSWIKILAYPRCVESSKIIHWQGKERFECTAISRAAITIHTAYCCAIHAAHTWLDRVWAAGVLQSIKLGFRNFLKGYGEMFQQSGISPARTEVIPMRNDAQQTCPFLFLRMLFVGQLVVAEFSVVCGD